MVSYNLVDVFLWGALIVAPTVVGIIAWKVYTGEFD